MAQVYDIPLVLPINSSNQFQIEMSTAKIPSSRKYNPSAYPGPIIYPHIPLYLITCRVRYCLGFFTTQVLNWYLQNGAST